MGQTEFSTSLASFNQAQLDQIQTSANNIQTSVNTIKNTDLSNVNTNVIGVSTNVNTVNTKVGANTDGAGTTTLFARVAKIDNSVATIPTAIDKLTCNNVQCVSSNMAAPVAGTWFTALSVSGRGSLFRAFCSYPAIPTSYQQIRVTVDGVATTMTGNLARQYTSAREGIDLIANVQFDTSLLVEFNYTSGSPGTCTGGVDYGLL
jgi:hypothetical protein